MIGVPTYNTEITAHLYHGIRESTKHYEVDVVFQSMSLLAFNFNNLWCIALNKNYSHFCMVHADLSMDAGWLDTLMNEMNTHGADVLSAIIPIKNNSGETSTGFDLSRGDGKETDEFLIKKITLKEAYAMTEATWTHEKLLLNTGLMLVNMRKDWVKKIHFHMIDKIIKTENGYRPLCVSEDWQFSRDAKALGAKLYCTRKVRVVHLGGGAYPNDGPWGTK